MKSFSNAQINMKQHLMKEIFNKAYWGARSEGVIPGVQVPHLGELVWLRCNAPVGISQATPMSRQKKILKLQFIAERKFLSRANVAQPRRA